MLNVGTFEEYTSAGRHPCKWNYKVILSVRDTYTGTLSLQTATLDLCYRNMQDEDADAE